MATRIDRITEITPYMSIDGYIISINFVSHSKATVQLIVDLLHHATIRMSPYSAKAKFYQLDFYEDNDIFVYFVRVPIETMFIDSIEIKLNGEFSKTVPFTFIAQER